MGTEARWLQSGADFFRLPFFLSLSLVDWCVVVSSRCRTVGCTVVSEEDGRRRDGRERASKKEHEKKKKPRKPRGLDVVHERTRRLCKSGAATFFLSDACLGCFF